MLALRHALFAWHARSHDLHKVTARTLGKSLRRAYLAIITYNAKAEEVVARHRVLRIFSTAAKVVDHCDYCHDF